MKQKKFFIFTILGILAVVTILAIFFSLHASYFFVGQKETNLQEYVDMAPENNYLPEEGYISDAKTAAQIGNAVISNLYNEGFLEFGLVEVEYDSDNRLWKVTKGYLFHSGGFVILEQDTGRIVRALLQR